MSFLCKIGIHNWYHGNFQTGERSKYTGDHIGYRAKRCIHCGKEVVLETDTVNCAMCGKEKLKDGHNCCEDCGGVPF